MSSQPLFDPFTLYDGLCTFAIMVGSMIAAGGGLGGGGVFVPIYILILSFGTKHAAALSQATIFGGSIVNLIMNWKTTHPKRPHRPITDFSTLLVFEPMLLVGTVLGVLLNVIFPAMLILILLIVTLLYATFRTTRKGYTMWTAETEALEGPSISGYITNGNGPSIKNTNKNTDIDDTENKLGADTASILRGYDSKDELIKPNSDRMDDMIQLTDTTMMEYDIEREKLINRTSGSYGSLTGSTSDIIGDGIPNNTSYDPSLWSEMAFMCGVDISQLDKKKIDILRPLMEKEKEIWKPIIIIGIIWIISSVTSIGKNDTITGVEACSPIYWTITFISFPILLIISIYITRQQYINYDLKESSNGWIKAEGDIIWNKSMMNMIKYPLIATIAGLLGGLLGIGGGMIVSPLLMELGVLPSVAAATSAMAVLITSSSATLQFILLGYLNLDYTFYFMAIGVIGTFIGQTVVTYSIKQYGRKSLIVFSVAAIMGGAVILMGIDGIIQMIQGISWLFESPC